MKRLAKTIAFSVLLVVSLLAMSCAPAAPAPRPATPAPKPVAPSAPAPQPAPSAPAPKARTIIRLIDSGVGSSTWVWFTAVAFLAEKHSSWLRCDVMPTKGMAEALHFLLEKKGEISSTTPNFAVSAAQGVAEFKDLGARSDVRLITNLSNFYQHTIVLDRSPIKAFTYDDLKGKTIATREPGSLSAVAALAYLKAVGLDPKKDVRVLYMKLADVVNALLDGTADVLLSISGSPFPAYEEMFTSKPCRLIPMPAELTKKANEAAGVGMVVATFPAGLYKGQKEAVFTSASYGLVVTRQDVSDEIVGELTRLWWDYLDERNELSAEIARQATVADLKANATLGIEFHKAALKYYQGKGWIK